MDGEALGSGAQALCGGGGGLSSLRQQGRDFLDKAPALLVGKIAVQTGLDTGSEVIPKHVGLNTAQARDHRADLVRDFNAVTLVLDHLLQPAYLSFKPAQTGQLPGVVDGHASMLVRIAHPVSLFNVSYARRRTCSTGTHLPDAGELLGRQGQQRFL